MDRDDELALVAACVVLILYFAFRQNSSPVVVSGATKKSSGTPGQIGGPGTNYTAKTSTLPTSSGNMGSDGSGEPGAYTYGGDGNSEEDGAGDVDGWSGGGGGGGDDEIWTGNPELNPFVDGC